MISGIGGSYEQALTQATGSNKKLDNTLSKDYTNSSDEELMEVAKEFEAYFLEQMFKSMQKMVPESEYTSSTTKTMTEYYQEQLLSEYANNATETSDEGVGIAQLIYEQMKRNYNL
ncbi:MAG: rod-binding protein [Lachnospiraceae bacterium]|nr:hypothetical protein [Lachnospira sp.]MBQ8730238.1 rod-binding protein [Lachnospiraceae bacterium]MBR6697230.1 rod-binding protein [Lachnospiraceae bacterium]